MTGSSPGRLIAILLVLLQCAPAEAAEPPSNWTGFYLGGHLGAFHGTTGFSDPAGPSLFGGEVDTPGFMAGAQLGYNWQFAPQWLAGLEGSGSFLFSSGSNTCAQATVAVIGPNCKASPRELATVTSRLGFLTEPQGRTLLYGKGGLAWMRTDVSLNPNNAFVNLEGATLSGQPLQGGPNSMTLSSLGWTLGAGVEMALSPMWSLAAEYNYLHFSGHGMATPATSSVTTGDGEVSTVPSSFSNITQNLHLVRLGLNYRWGAAAKGASAAEASQLAPEAAWTREWEFDVGGRYWYSSGRQQNSNGTTPNVLLSRLSYDRVQGHTGEVFARVDAPFDMFVKGFVGGGVLGRGTMYDEDWGLSNNGPPVGYEVTESNVSGSINYITGDIGYNVLRARDHRVGLFVGYNRFQTVMDAFGCTQSVNPGSGYCQPAIAGNVKIISQFDTWHAVRLGASAEAAPWDRFRIGVDIAYLPYVYLDSLDIHRVRDPAVYFPVEGTGQGVQAEILLSYRATDRLSFGIGGRYWSMWTTYASQFDFPDNVFTTQVERYGVFVQASYRFGVP
jgi:opacity protein-like surface antigen